MPTSVLLAVLAAAGLLALAPALVRRYDATERLAAERALSTARVLQRRRRRRSVPGRQPVRTSRVLVVTLRAASPSPSQSDAVGDSQRRGRYRPERNAPHDRATRGRSSRDRGLRAVAVPTEGRVARPRPTRRRPPVHRQPPVVYRRRRVFAALVMLNLAELVGVVLVSPGFWTGFSVTAVMLVGYVVHLRNLAIADARRRREEAREAAWLAARQAEVRREQARRAAARREMQRRLAEQRESVRRAARGGTGVTSASYSYRRTGGLRGRPYQAGPTSSRSA